MAAIRILGKRIFQIILYAVASPLLVKMILKISGTDMCTLPVLIFSTVIRQNAKIRPIKTTAYLDRLRKFSI